MGFFRTKRRLSQGGIEITEDAAHSFCEYRRYLHPSIYIITRSFCSLCLGRHRLIMLVVPWLENSQSISITRRSQWTAQLVQQLRLRARTYNSAVQTSRTILEQDAVFLSVYLRDKVNDPSYFSIKSTLDLLRNEIDMIISSGISIPSTCGLPMSLTTSILALLSSQRPSVH